MCKIQWFFPKLNNIISSINYPYPIPISLPNYQYPFSRRRPRRSHNRREQEEIRFPPTPLRDPVPAVPEHPGQRSGRERAFHAFRTGATGPGQDLLQGQTGGQRPGSTGHVVVDQERQGQ